MWSLFHFPSGRRPSAVFIIGKTRVAPCPGEAGNGDYPSHLVIFIIQPGLAVGITDPGHVAHEVIPVFGGISVTIRHYLLNFMNAVKGVRTKTILIVVVYQGNPAV